MRGARALVLWTLVARLFPQAASFDPLKTVARDLAALRMRSTARHIMRPKTKDGRGQCEVRVATSPIAPRFATSAVSGRLYHP